MAVWMQVSRGGGVQCAKFFPAVFSHFHGTSTTNHVVLYSLHSQPQASAPLSMGQVGTD